MQFSSRTAIYLFLMNYLSIYISILAHPWVGSKYFGGYCSTSLRQFLQTNFVDICPGVFNVKIM